jgi:hypothetical protein
VPPLPIVQPHYGSDLTGLVCGYRFADNLRGEAIDSASAAAWLATRAADGAFLSESSRGCSG